ETILRRPAEADRRTVGLRPVPVDAAIELFGELADFDFLVLGAAEVGLAEKDARHQDRGMDGGELAVVEPLPGLHVEEVIEKAFVAGDAALRRTLRRVVEEAQRGENTL